MRLSDIIKFNRNDIGFDVARWMLLTQDHVLLRHLLLPVLDFRILPLECAVFVVYFSGQKMQISNAFINQISV